MSPEKTVPARKAAVGVIVCGVAVVRRGRRQFLIAQRAKNDTFGSFWEFPGGKKHPAETLKQCVERESREEVGIGVKVKHRFLSIRRRMHGKIIWLNFFLCSHLSGQPRPLECQRVLWADLADLKNYRFPPANERVIACLEKRFGG